MHGTTTDIDGGKAGGECAPPHERWRCEQRQWLQRRRNTARPAAAAALRLRRRLGLEGKVEDG